MKKILLLFILLLLPISVDAKELVNLYMFWGDGCPHCEHLKEYLNEIKGNYSNLNIVEYEVWYNDDNKKLLETVKNKLDSSARGVPYIVIGDVGISGFNEDTKTSIVNLLDKCSFNKCSDIMKKLEEENISIDNKVVKKNNRGLILGVFTIVLLSTTAILFIINLIKRKQ